MAKGTDLLTNQDKSQMFELTNLQNSVWALGHQQILLWWFQTPRKLQNSIRAEKIKQGSEQKTSLTKKKYEMGA